VKAKQKKRGKEGEKSRGAKGKKKNWFQTGKKGVKKGMRKQLEKKEGLEQGLFRRPERMEKKKRRALEAIRM